MRDTRDTAQEEANALRRLAARMERDGRGATAILLLNTAFLLADGDMSEYNWSTRADGKTDDADIKGIIR